MGMPQGLQALLSSLCVYFTQMYISSGIRVPGSLVDRVIEFGASPLYLNHNFSPPANEPNGVVDSLRAMLLSENYVKPWCCEYMLVKLLTRSF